MFKFFSTIIFFFPIICYGESYKVECLFSEALPVGNNCSNFVPNITVNNNSLDFNIFIVDNNSHTRLITYKLKEKKDFLDYIDIFPAVNHYLNLSEVINDSSPKITLWENKQGYYLSTMEGYIGSFKLIKDKEDNYTSQKVWSRNDFLSVLGLVQGGNEIYMQDGKNTIYCLNHNNGEELWEEKADLYSSCILLPYINPMIVNNYLMVFLNNAQLKIIPDNYIRQTQQKLKPFPILSLNSYSDYIFNPIYQNIKNPNHKIILSALGTILNIDFKTNSHHNTLINTESYHSAIHVSKFTENINGKKEKKYIVDSNFIPANNRNSSIEDAEDLFFVLDNNTNICKINNNKNSVKILGNVKEILNDPIDSYMTYHGIFLIRKNLFLIIDYYGKFYFIEGPIYKKEDGGKKKIKPASLYYSCSSKLRNIRQIMYIGEWNDKILLIALTENGVLSLFSISKSP